MAASRPSALSGLAAVLEEPRDETPQADTSAIPAAVLVPILPLPSGDPGILLTRRRPDLPSHGGEISFPGGRWEEQDRTLLRTALREAEEEIGLDPGRVSVLGRLDPVLTFVSNHRIWPYVGLVSSGEPWCPSPLEVESVLELSLAELRSAHRRVVLELPSGPRRTEAYVIGENTIWGATCRILEALFAGFDRALDA